MNTRERPADRGIAEDTPELAELWLSKNPNNRDLRKAVVEGYARDIEVGRWHVDGETVKFDCRRPSA